MSKVISVEVKMNTQLFYKNDYGIFSVDVIDTDDWDKIEYNQFNNIVIKGGMELLSKDKTYIAEVEPKRDKRGLSYEVKMIYEKTLSTQAEIVTFLKTLLTENQVENILKVYPTENVVELIKSDTFDYSRVKGLGDKNYQLVKDKIIENEKYKKAIIELSSKYEIPYKAIKSLTDKYGSPDLLVKKIEENPYVLTEVDGYGFKKADEFAIKMGVEPTSSNRINACILHVLNEEADSGHCWTKYNSVINKIIKLLRIKISDIKPVLSDVEGKPYGITEEKVFLNRYLSYELGIALHAKRLLNSEVNYVVDNIEDKISKVEEAQGFKFTDEQVKAIHFAVKYNILVVIGKAGTGKTAVIKGIVEVLNTIQKPVMYISESGQEFQFNSQLTGQPVTESLSYATCALSGKASQRIQQSTGLDSSTIHRLLSYDPIYRNFTFHESNPLPHDVVILDEGSMANGELGCALIQAVKTGSKLIITGDTAQLEAIGMGNVLMDLISSDYVPFVELTKVHRQAQLSGILSSANLVREGKKFIDNPKSGCTKIGELEDLYLYAYNDSEKILKRVLNIAKNYSGDILDFQVLAPMKKRGSLSTLELNKELQYIFNEESTLAEDNRVIKRKDHFIAENDKVILNGNNYDKGVFNGTIGIVKYINTKAVEDSGAIYTEIVIDFEGVGNIRISEDEMKSVDLAYAISIHKSQGSQWKYVVLALDYASYILLNRQLLYTGMTRAESFLFLCVEVKALFYSIEKDNAVKRRTFLKDLF